MGGYCTLAMALSWAVMVKVPLLTKLRSSTWVVMKQWGINCFPTQPFSGSTGRFQKSHVLPLHGQYGDDPLHGHKPSWSLLFHLWRALYGWLTNTCLEKIDSSSKQTSTGPSIRSWSLLLKERTGGPLCVLLFIHWFINLFISQFWNSLFIRLYKY